MSTPLVGKTSMNTPWAITPEKVDAAVRKVAELAGPSRIILFGSFARGDSHRDSDLDMLVGTGEETGNPRQESVRLRRALRGISMPVDILVISEQRRSELAERPGLIYREALRERRVIYEER